MNGEYSDPMQLTADQLAAKHGRMIKERAEPAVAERKQSADPWAGRSKGMRCRTCIWFVAKSVAGLVAPKEEAPVVGRCRRHAPSMGGYPVVFQTDWCGDHRLDENKV